MLGQCLMECFCETFGRAFFEAVPIKFWAPPLAIICFVMGIHTFLQNQAMTPVPIMH